MLMEGSWDCRQALPAIVVHWLSQHISHHSTVVIPVLPQAPQSSEAKTVYIRVVITSMLGSNADPWSSTTQQPYTYFVDPSVSSPKLAVTAKLSH